MENALENEGVKDGSVIEIRKAGIIPHCDGIILPGGESTTISRHLKRTGVEEEIKEISLSGVPIMATCAGLIVISKNVNGEKRFEPLELLDVEIERNAFGTQRESFESDLVVKGFDQPYHAVFIRAPAITGWSKKVNVLAQIDELAVAVTQDNLIGLAFHPELTSDLRFHKMFLSKT